MNLVNNKKDNGELLRKIGIVTLALLFFTAFESKALINMFTGISLLSSLTYISLYNRKILKNNCYLLIFIVPYLIGFLLNFLSDTGVTSALDFLDRFKFMLLIIPLAVFVKDRKELHILLMMFFISATVAICYGIYADQPYSLFHGFHKIGRTADMMVVACLAALVYLIQSRFTLSLKTISFKLLMAFATTFFAWAIMMSEIRGSWLGLTVGCISFICISLLLHRKVLILKLLILISIIISIIFIVNTSENIDKIDLQVKSIVETQNNESNEARLHLWKTGWDFSKDHFAFGTGAKQSKDRFITFFNSQPDDYRKKYHYAIKYPGEYHNSYIQIYVETGAIFFIVYMVSILYPLFIILKNIKKVKAEDQVYLIATVVTSTAFLVTQLFHSDLYRYGSTVFYLVLFSGCFILHQNNPRVWFQKGNKK